MILGLVTESSTPTFMYNLTSATASWRNRGNLSQDSILAEVCAKQQQS